MTLDIIDFYLSSKNQEIWNLTKISAKKHKFWSLNRNKKFHFGVYMKLKKLLIDEELSDKGDLDD